MRRALITALTFFLILAPAFAQNPLIKPLPKALQQVIDQFDFSWGMTATYASYFLGEYDFVNLLSGQNSTPQIALYGNSDAYFPGDVWIDYGDYNGTELSSRFIVQKSIDENVFEVINTDSDCENIANKYDFRLGVPDTLRNLIISERNDTEKDFGLSASDNPTIFLFDADADSYLSLGWSDDDKPMVNVGGSATAFKVNNPIITKISTLDCSNPPTDAELDAEFGTPATVGSGWQIYIDDNGAGAHFYLVVSDGTNWWIFTATIAS